MGPLALKEPKPLDKKIVSVLFISLFANAVTLTMLFPFVGFMIMDFGIVKTKSEAGYYAGLVASSLFFGRAIGSYPWGWVADTWGRRPVMIISLLGLVVFTLMFGFSYNLAWAIAARFLTGVINGLIGACKAIISEISDETNQAQGMSIVGTAWGIGLIMGPAVGGILSEPALKHPHIFSANSLFGKFPYLLPCLFSVGLSLIALVLVVLYLPETLPPSRRAPARDAKTQRIAKADEIRLGRVFKARKSDAYHPVSVTEDDEDCSSNAHAEGEGNGVGVNDASLADATGRKRQDVHHSVVEDTIDEETAADVAHFEDDDPIDNEFASGHARQGCGRRAWVRTKRAVTWYLARSTLVTLLRDRLVLLSVIMYAVFSMASIGFDEVYSLWCLADEERGGLAFTSDQIGYSLAIVGAALLLFSVTTYPRIERRLGAVMTYVVCGTLLVVTVVIFPSVSLFRDKKPLVWTSLLTLTSIVRFASNACFTSTSIIVNNTVGPERRGAVNGLANSVTSIARTLGPSLGGSVFAWSLTTGHNIGFPFDYHLIFIIFGFIFLVSVWMAAALPLSINTPKDSAGKALPRPADEGSAPMNMSTLSLGEAP